VLKVKAKGHRDFVTVVGSLASVSPGEWVTAEGGWVQDREFGLHFRAEMLDSTAPTMREGIEKSARPASSLCEWAPLPRQTSQRLTADHPAFVPERTGCPFRLRVNGGVPKHGCVQTTFPTTKCGPSLSPELRFCLWGVVKNYVVTNRPQKSGLRFFHLSHSVFANLLFNDHNLIFSGL
jgi:hypothetical protein